MTSEQRPPVNNGHFSGVPRVVIEHKFDCICDPKKDENKQFLNCHLNRKSYLQLLLSLRHEFELFTGLELQFGNCRWKEKSKDDLESRILSHSEATHPEVGENDL